MASLHDNRTEAAFFDYIRQGSPFSRRLGIDAYRTGEGTAEGTLSLLPEYRNMFGSLHGGLYSTLADCVGGQAAMSVSGCPCATLDSTVHFLAPAEGTILRAQARVVHAGSRTVICNVELHDEAGTLCAQATLTFCPCRPRKRGNTETE